MRGPICRCKSDVDSTREWGDVLLPGGIDMHALRGSALPCFTVPPSRAGALKCMSHVNTFFFNIFCAGTAPEGRGRTGDIKKGLLYWFITTVAQQCTITRRRSSLSGLVNAILDDPNVIPNYPYQDQEHNHIPTREGR